jgi:hypothetical protein
LVLLPVVTPETRKKLDEYIAKSEEQWKREMIHHLKEENPEINSLLLELAQNSTDPKNVVMAGYLVYKALEMAQTEESQESMDMIES